MADLTVEVKGLAELQRTLQEMPRDVARKVLRTSLREAAEDLREEMATQAPRKSGLLASHFNLRVRLTSNELAGTAHVGPEGKVYYPGGDRSHGVATGRHPHRGGLVPVVSVARFLEFGTSRMPAHPFMRQSFETLKSALVDKITEGIRSAIAKWTK